MACACLTLVAGALILLIIYLTRKYTHWTRHKIPTAKGAISLFGHVLPLVTSESNYAFLSQHAYNQFKNSSMIGYYILTSPALLIRDPNLVKTILQTNFSSFHKNGWKIEPSVDPLLVRNPFFCDGDVWVSRRNRLANAFSSMRLTTIFDTISGVCKKFEAFLDRRLKSSDKYEVELKYLFSKFTGEVVANVGFGIEGFCFQDEPHPMAFDRIGDGIFKPSAIGAMLKSVAFIWPKLNNILGIKFIPSDINELFRNLVAENLAVRQNETTPRNDFLQLIIELEQTEGGNVDKEAVAGHVLSLYLDGFETSSISLSLICYQLVLHKDIQERLRGEVQSMIAKHGGQLMFEALKGMKYMDQVINESQRCIATVGVLRKECTEECQLQGSDGLSYRVKPGTRILIPIKLLHADPEYWPDPQVFDPDRFSEERKNEIKKMTFLPFGEGPRMCVGMRMALLQIKSCLASLLNNYKLELSAKTQLPLQMFPSISLTVPVGGIWVNISKL